MPGFNTTCTSEVKKRFQAFAFTFNLYRYTPGTPFMARLSEHLRFYVMKKQTEDPLWQKATVILSGHEVGLALTPGCQIGYVDHTGCYQLVFFTIRLTRVVSPGGVRLATWSILAVIHWCFDCKICMVFDCKMTR